MPLRNNNVDGATDRQIRYVTDTDNGSSGPPLLTDDLGSLRVGCLPTTSASPPTGSRHGSPNQVP